MACQLFEKILHELKYILAVWLEMSSIYMYVEQSSR